MDSATLTALATGLLVIVGVAQVGVLVAQKRHSRLELIEMYRKRWHDANDGWSATIFLGREAGEYYQVANPSTLEQLTKATRDATLHAPTRWALDSVRAICTILSDVCLKVLQGQLEVGDAYPVFGSELLRHSRPLRILLDRTFETSSRTGAFAQDDAVQDHKLVRREVQDWLIYHDGTRRRCLILIDLLWAEAARLEDLPPSDLRSAADAKRQSGPKSRARLSREIRRLNGLFGAYRAFRLSHFLRHAEYEDKLLQIGINPERLQELDAAWVDRLLQGRK